VFKRGGSWGFRIELIGTELEWSSERRYQTEGGGEVSFRLEAARDRVLGRIDATTNNLSLAELELAACQIECLMTHRPRRRIRRRGAVTR
jgi:hypothetical protein